MTPRTESFGHYGSRFREFKHVIPVSGHASSKSRHAATGPILWEREEVECISRRLVSGGPLIELSVTAPLHSYIKGRDSTSFVLKKVFAQSGFS